MHCDTGSGDKVHVSQGQEAPMAQGQEPWFTWHRVRKQGLGVTPSK
jgi:hypothetical protein